jgi:hypothetical protein
VRRATGTPGLGAHLPGEAATGQEMAPKPRQNSKQAYFVGCYGWLLKIARVRARYLVGPDITPRRPARFCEGPQVFRRGGQGAREAAIAVSTAWAPRLAL